jgi:hypothetical protein
MTEEPRYWFRAKRYGWGWGLPLVWQGWVVLLGFVVLLIVGSALILPAKHVALHLAYVIVSSAALIGICYAKGEPPKWRWGGR